MPDACGTKPDAPRQLVRSSGFWVALLLGTVIVWASFYNLANYPDLWWDEAIFSETAANVVQHGRYAFTVQSPNQLSDFDFRISAGPSIILPVALSYRLLGVGLVQGRLVAGLYLVFAFLALFLVSRRLFGPAAAFLALFLALLGTDVVHWGRSVLGDVPALGLFLFGVWLIIRSLEEDSPASLFLGGLFLGLAFDAKEFYGMTFLPPLAALAWQNWRSWRPLIRKVLLYVLGVSIPLLSYLAFKAVILGGLMPAVLHFLRQKALLCHEFFTPLTVGKFYTESFRYLLTNPLYLAGLLGFFWLWRKDRLTLSRVLWLAYFFLWSLVYLTAIFWPRFALPALFLASPLAAYLLYRVWAHLTNGLAPRPLKWVTAGLLAAAFFWFLPVTGLNYINGVALYQKNTPNRLVAYLQKHVPRRALIETPEYELVFLDDDHRIHTMPAYFIIQSGEKGVELLNPRHDPYNFNKTKADVLVLGYFGKSIFAQIYPPALIHKYWQKVAQLDYYDIYVRRSSALLKSDFLLKSSSSPSLPILKARGNEVNDPKTLRRSVSH
jgi:4-amino-4-deoxy-L-arabinose transferase-like glycosyltransferase